MQKKEIRRLALTYTAGYSHLYLVILLIILLGVILNMSIPYIYGQVIDQITALNFDKSLRYIILYGTIMIICSILSIIESKLAYVINGKIEKKYKDILFSKILNMQVPFLEQFDSGVLISRLNSDLATVISYNTELLTSIVFVLFNFMVPVCFILSISLQLSILSFVFLPMSTVIYLLFRKRQNKIAYERQNLSDNYYSFQSNIFKGLQALKGLRIEKKIEQSFNIYTKKNYDIELKSINLTNIVGLCNEVTNNVFGIVIILLSAILILKGSLTVGLMVSFNIYINKLFSSIASIQKIRLNEELLVVALERLSTILDSPQEGHTLNGEFASSCNTANVISLDLRNISFGYEEKKILDEVNLFVEGNGLYSIVGKNGCGKTTLLKLLLKYYEPKSGSIYINKYPYSTLSSLDIRNLITYITKESFVLQDSIKNNISINTELSDKVAKDILKKVGLLDLIENLPNGIDTLLTNAETLLSSGMKQKLAFARAIAIGSPIMVLDEITSDLDGDSENQILSVINELSHNHIIISVSHKKAMVLNSKKIFVLNEGRIIASGKFNNLSDSCELFRLLFINYV